MLTLTGGIVRFAWELGLRGLDHPSRTWEKTLRLSRWLRMPARPSQTPSEFAEEVSRRTGLNEEPRLVADGYLRARYGHKPIDEQEQKRLDGAWVKVRNRLFKRLLHLK